MLGDKLHELWQPQRSRTARTGDFSNVSMHHFSFRAVLYSLSFNIRALSLIPNEPTNDWIFGWTVWWINCEVLRVCVSGRDRVLSFNMWWVGVCSFTNCQWNVRERWSVSLQNIWLWRCYFLKNVQLLWVFLAQWGWRQILSVWRADKKKSRWGSQLGRLLTVYRDIWLYRDKQNQTAHMKSRKGNIQLHRTCTLETVKV